MRSARARSRTEGRGGAGASAREATRCRTPSSIWLQSGVGSAASRRIRGPGAGGIQCHSVLVPYDTCQARRPALFDRVGRSAGDSADMSLLFLSLLLAAPLVLRDVTVVDVEGGRLQRGTTVVVEGERITRVGGTGAVPGAG